VKRIFWHVLILSVVAFALHLVWELLHIPLYTGYEHLSPTLPISIYATSGDVLYTLGVFVFVSVANRSWNWATRIHSREVAWLAATGLLIALFVEYKALALARWEYVDAMPIIPFTNVGLSPIAQMTILLPLSFFIAAALSNRCSKYLP